MRLAVAVLAEEVILLTNREEWRLRVTVAGLLGTVLRAVRLGRLKTVQAEAAGQEQWVEVPLHGF